MGLLDIPRPKPQGNAAPEAAQEGVPPDEAYVADDESNVTPEEQAQYDQAQKNAEKLIYVKGEDGGEVRPEILESLRSDAPPPDPNAPPTPPVEPGAEGAEGAAPAGNAPILALANTAVTVVSGLDDSAREAGQPIEDAVLYHIGVYVIEELSEIALHAKIYDYTEEEMAGALAQAIDIYRPKLIGDGRTSEETLKAQFAEVNDADAAGKLGDVLPGMGGQTVGEPPIAAE